MLMFPRPLAMALLPLFVASSPALADPSDLDSTKLPVAFRDVPFGASPTEVGQKLPMLKKLQQGPDSVAFAGTLDGRAVQVHALFTPRSQRLWKVGVVYLQPVDRPFDELEAVWRREWEALSETLGYPSRREALFKGPVPSGQERKALEAGNGQFTAVWQLADGYVACDLSRYGNLVVSYEHARLSALESEERAAASPRPAPSKK